MSAEPAAVIVTGVSGSIGLATAERLRGRGLSCIGWDREPPPEGRFAGEFVQCDLVDDDQVEAAADAASAHGLPVRHVVAVAGGGDLDELATPDVTKESLATFRRVLETNLVSAFTTVKTTVRLLRSSQGDRSITLISSINAHGGFGAPGYSAAKAGISGLVRSLAPSLGRDGIRLNCLALGTTRTANLLRLVEARDNSTDHLAQLAERSPLQRILDPDDVARAVTAMTLDMPGLTGAEVVLDNGQSLMR